MVTSIYSGLVNVAVFLWSMPSNQSHPEQYMLDDGGSALPRR